MESIRSRQLTTVNILGAANEICQVILLSDRIIATLHITFSLKDKGQTSESGLHLFCIKVTCNEAVPYIKLFEEKCLPQLCQVICEMQDQEKESHLALQAADVFICKQRKTMLLWLESEAETSSVTVNILCETITPIEEDDQILTVLEIRVLIPLTDIIHFSKGMLNLLERIKFLNPKVQLSFSLHSLTSLKVDLCTTSISCETFLVYSGYDLFLGKNTSHFTGQMLKVKSSKNYEVKFQGKENKAEFASLTCISCFVPICPVYEQSTSNTDSHHPKGQQSFGQIRIQVYGPANLPFDMEVVTSRLTLNPATLLPWHRLGLQVKKSFSCSSYDLHCSARITNIEAVPEWAVQSQHFCMMIAFVFSGMGRPSDADNTICTRQELFRHVEQHALNKEVYSIFQEAAFGCLANLLSQDRPAITTPQKNQDTRSDLFTKMIPDVTNSLTDIYIRSTSVDFRSQVAAIVPTSSRAKMSSYLNESLWQMIFKPGVNPQNLVTSDETKEKLEELQLANLNIGHDRLCSAEGEEDKAMSPDSLDLEWDSSCSSTVYHLDKTESTAVKSMPGEDAFRRSCISPAQQIISDREITTDRDFSDNFPSTEYLQIIPDRVISNNFLPTENLLWPSNFNDEHLYSSEKEFELWDYSEDSLTAVYDDTCTTNTKTTNTYFSPVVEQGTVDVGLDNFSSCFREGNTCQPKPEFLSVIGNLTDHTVEDLIHYCNAAPARNCVEKMPRKRSSEFMNDTVSASVDHIPETLNTGNANTLNEGKKPRCQSSDPYSYTDVSHCKEQSKLDSLELKKSDEVQIELNNFDLDDADAFSSCWFDEEEVANWCAELDK